MSGKIANFTADFETATWLTNETYVWCWAVCNIDNTDQTEWGTNLDDFMLWCSCNPKSKIYFHNLKFDGEFIIHYLLKNGYTFYTGKKRNPKTFTAIISDMGQFYSISVNFDKENYVTFFDSLKMIPLKVDEMPKAFGLDIKKLDLDYNKPRPKGYTPTQSELDYILNDVKIPALSLKKMFDSGLNKMTQASNALCDYKQIMGINTFNHFFKLLDKELKDDDGNPIIKKDHRGQPINYKDGSPRYLLLDDEIRKSYKGGFTYLNPLYTEKIVRRGIVLDVNSLYPSVMYNSKLPIDYPIFFEGKYQPDHIYDLYIQRIRCSFELKSNKIPTIQIKGSADWCKEFDSTEYLKHSKGRVIPLTLTSVDLKLFFENYDVQELEYLGGWKFRSAVGLFDKYIDKWIGHKIQAKKDNNKGMYFIAKIMLNALYGRFGIGLEMQSKIPYLDDGIVKYRTTEPEKRKGLYIPLATFITAYAREVTIRTSQKIRDYSLEKYGQDMYIYSDTDSIHTLLSKNELIKICNIDDYQLGAWKVENYFKKGKFVRQKGYVEDIPDFKAIQNHKKQKYKLKITCAGLPENCYEQVTYDNFKLNAEYEGKLTYEHVKGGVKLVETNFKIREKLFAKRLK